MIWYVGVTMVLGLALGLPIRLFARERALWLATVWSGALLAGARVICGIRGWSADGRTYRKERR